MYISRGLRITASAKGIPVPKQNPTFGLNYSLLTNGQFPNLSRVNCKNHKSRCSFLPGLKYNMQCTASFPFFVCCIYLHSLMLIPSLLYSSGYTNTRCLKQTYQILQNSSSSKKENSVAIPILLDQTTACVGNGTEHCMGEPWNIKLESKIICIVLCKCIESCETF